MSRLVEREPFWTCSPCPATGALRMVARTHGMEVTGGSIGHGPDGFAIVTACDALVGQTNAGWPSQMELQGERHDLDGNCRARLM